MTYPLDDNFRLEQNIKACVHKQIVSVWLNGDQRGFDDHTDLQHTGILDSFSTMSLVAFIEDQFHLTFDPVDINADTFKSITTIAQVVAKKVGQASIRRIS
jgi:acyl carrier protein